MDLSTFKFFVEQFIAHLISNQEASSHTVKAYERDLNQLLSFWESIEKAEQTALSSYQIVARYERWLFAQSFSSSSIARKCSCLSTLTRFLHAQGKTERFLIQRPVLEQKNPVSIPFTKLFAFFDRLSLGQIPTKYPYRDRAIIELLYATGASSSELAQIIIRDIDFHQQVISIYGSKKRLVLFGSHAHEKIEAYLKIERGEYTENDPLFVNYKNERLTVRSIQRVCRMFASLLGNSKITPTLIRNSFATHLLAKGADAHIVKNLLGYVTEYSIEKYKHKKACTSHPKK